MRINKVFLHNIRSHKESELEFTDGICVISGSNGSGKSSIAMAIEYALFGSSSRINKNAILRRGAKTGRIELFFEHNKKHYRVSRGLRRSGSSIIMDRDRTGFYVDGKDILQIKRETDLNEKIIDVLGYPDEKSRDLFVITSYVRQEEIKNLIDMTETQRKEYIDGVLNLSRYNVAWENLRDLLRELETQKRLFEKDTKYKKEFGEQKEGLAEKSKKIGKEILSAKRDIARAEKDYKEAKAIFARIEREKERMEEKKSGIEKSLEILDIRRKEKEKEKKELDGLEKEIQEFEEKRQELLKEKQESLEKRKKEIEELEKEIAGVDFDPKMDYDSLLAQFSEAKNSLEFLEKEMEKLEREYSFTHGIKSGVCPVCKQEVKEEHLESVKKDFEDKKQVLEKKIQEKIQEKGSLEKGLERAKQNKEKKQQKKELEQEIETLKHRKSMVEESIQEHKKNTEQMRKNLVEQEEKLKKDIGALEKEIKQLEKQDHGFDQESFEKIKQKHKQTIDKLSEKRAEFESQKEKLSQLEERQKEYEKEIDKLEKKLEEVKRVEKKLEWTIGMHSLLERMREDIRNISQVVRKKFICQFRTDFQNRFEEIRGEQDYLVDMDINYAPMVFDEGEEVDVSFLSGGERTSIALAYRLALSDLASQLGGIGRSQMLILDEPTENLDKESIKSLPYVFRNIRNIPQIILITHEIELKEAADYTYEVEKRGKNSTVQ